MALEILGVELAGVFVGDCLALYDDLNPLQQKCSSHHRKAIKQAGAVPPEQGAGCLANVKAMLQGAMALKKAQPDMTEQEFILRRQGLEMAATALLAEPRPQPAEERVRPRLCQQNDQLFTFLDYPEVDATNNRAERQLRPAVISRKISCGNKTVAGAQTWQVLNSLAAACAQRGQSFLNFVRTVLPWGQKPIVNLSG